MTKPDARTCVRTSKRPGSSSAANAVFHPVGYLAAQFYDDVEPGEDQAAAPLPAPGVGFPAVGKPFPTDRWVLSPIDAAGAACRAARCGSLCLADGIIAVGRRRIPDETGGVTADRASLSAGGNGLPASTELAFQSH
jgi:hypothetical protein